MYICQVLYRHIQQKKYRIGGWVHYELNKDAPVGPPDGVEIESSSQEEADKLAKEMCEVEALNRHDGVVHDFWAKKVEK